MTLALKVATRNKVNSKANYVYSYLKDLFSNYENKKIVKFSPYKTFTAQIKKEIEIFQAHLSEQNFRLVFDFGHGYISAILDTTYPVSEFAVNYVKQEFSIVSYICETGVMTKFYDVYAFRTDFTEQEIVNKRAQIAELDLQISALKGEINRFEKGY